MVGSPQSIANTIAAQLGGYGALSAMVGASNFSYATDGSLSFHFKGSRKANMVRIVLLPSDTYALFFSRYNSRTLKVVTTGEIIGVYANQLVSALEHFTGLSLHL